MEKYVPDLYQKSIYSIDYKKLQKRGIKCLLFDLDNTLMPTNEKTADQKLIDLFNKLKEIGFKLIIFSNSSKARVKPFKEVLEVDCCAGVNKTKPEKFLYIIDHYKYNKSEIAIIGDEIMTDIIGGNRVGITTILVNPISTKDHLWTKVSRLSENRIMKKLRKKELFTKGRYYD